MFTSEQPHRILMTTDAVGGVWNYALELARGLGLLGIEVVLATMGPPPGVDQRAAAAALPNVTLCEGAYRLEWMENPWDDVAAAGDWLLGLERDFFPDLVHLNGYVHAALPWRAPVLAVGHSCVLSWWEAVRREPAPSAWDRYRAAVRAGLHAADLVVAPSQTMLAQLTQHYGPLGATAVIPNGRDAAAGPAPAKEPFVLAAGRWWDEAKNAALLAAAAPGLPWPVRLAGEIGAPQAAPANVTLLGRCPASAMAAHYARAAIFAAPARYEPFGLSVLEAALAGCALVLGDIPSLRENWEGAAVFVPTDDVSALHRALVGLIDAAARRTELGERARVRAQDFSTSRMIAAYAAAYARCLPAAALA
jgi:glycogen(starch) synthase